MPVKYIITKMKGAFYAGSEKLASSGLKLRKYMNLDAVKNVVRSLRLPAASLIFKGLTKNEQKKIIDASKEVKKAPKTKSKKKKKKSCK